MVISLKLMSPTGTNGIGKQAVQALAKHEPAHLYFTGRNINAANSIISELKNSLPDLSITFLSMDMSSLANVVSAAAQVAHDRIDLLICNGGILDVPPAVSAEGVEIHMATNHLAHAMLIRKLLPKMLHAAEQPDADVRLIVLSSAGYVTHPRGGVSWDTIRTKQGGFIEANYRYG
jgi:NAD(P)-dependent dehydrogenase (short-subunit alcohol dehydrogenase family)